MTTTTNPTSSTPSTQPTTPCRCTGVFLGQAAWHDRPDCPNDLGPIRSPQPDTDAGDVGNPTIPVPECPAWCQKDHHTDSYAVSEELDEVDRRYLHEWVTDGPGWGVAVAWFQEFNPDEEQEPAFIVTETPAEHLTASEARAMASRLIRAAAQLDPEGDRAYRAAELVRVIGDALGLSRAERLAVAETMRTPERPADLADLVRVADTLGVKPSEIAALKDQEAHRWDTLQDLVEREIEPALQAGEGVPGDFDTTAFVDDLRDAGYIVCDGRWWTLNLTSATFWRLVEARATGGQP